MPKFSLVNNKMKKSINIKLARFYLWLGLGYAALWIVGHLSTFQGTFLQSIGNNLWRVIYLTAVNFIFLEYTVPFVIRKRRFLIYNILLGILALWVHFMLWSYGMYGWRFLGIQLGVYAGLTTFASVNEGLAAQMSYSVACFSFT